MSKRTLLILSFALVLLLAPAGVVSASTPNAPTAAPCGPDTAYDPACDVNHDGVINVVDVQLTADKWNKSGDWFGDNDHDHLGQTWSGADNPLIIEGSFSALALAPLILTNRGTGDGLWVTEAGKSGLFISESGNDGIFIGRAGTLIGSPDPNPGVNGIEIAGAEDIGVYVGRAERSGIYVGSAHRSGVRVESAGSEGMMVASAGSFGVSVGSAGDDGVRVTTAGADGVGVYWAGSPTTTVCSTANNGFEVCGAEGDGLFVGHADGNGLNVAGADLAGYFGGHIQVADSCAGCVLTTFALNTGDTDLAPGDIVSLAGLRESGVDSVPMLMDVKSANGIDAVVGVVSGWAELVTEEEPRPNEIGQRLVPREGAAKPGQYVTVVYSGLAQVKVSVVDDPIVQGSKLVAGVGGTARAQRVVEVEGVKLAESASSIGIALEGPEADEGLVWALVNVQ